ncbi:MAG: DUF4157 domain-containing protein [Chloroflexota bacterium]|nr:MAG: DUF4157 domain-containing protein [Chloroflexota bacterium]
MTNPARSFDPSNTHAQETSDVPVQHAASQNGPTHEIPASVSETDRPVGQPLDSAARTYFESRFAQDFSRVKLHSDAQSQVLTSRHDALALTIGPDIFLDQEANFARGRAFPQILAHELAHVAQSQKKTRSPSSVPSLEQEATRAGARALAGNSAQVQQAAGNTPLALEKGWRALLFGLGGAIVGGLGALGLSAIGVGLSGLEIAGLIAGGGVAGLFINYLREKSREDAEQFQKNLQQMDAWIAGSYGMNLPRHLTADQAFRAHWKIVSEREFRDVYEAWPGRDQSVPYTEVGGFVDRSTTPPTIWIRAYTNNAFVRLHEAVHLYSQPAILSTNHNLREGATDYFARQIARREQISVTSDYDREFRVVNNLVAALGGGGEELLRRAYFQGELGQLTQAAIAAGIDWQQDIVEGGLADRPQLPQPPVPSPAPGSAAGVGG